MSKHEDSAEDDNRKSKSKRCKSQDDGTCSEDEMKSKSKKKSQNDDSEDDDRKAISKKKHKHRATGEGNSEEEDSTNGQKKPKSDSKSNRKKMEEKGSGVGSSDDEKDESDDLTCLAKRLSRKKVKSGKMESSGEKTDSTDNSAGMNKKNSKFEGKDKQESRKNESDTKIDSDENDQEEGEAIFSKVEVVMDIDGVGEKDLETGNSLEAKSVDVKSSRSRKLSKCGRSGSDSDKGKKKITECSDSSDSDEEKPKKGRRMKHESDSDGDKSKKGGKNDDSESNDKTGKTKNKKDKKKKDSQDSENDFETAKISKKTSRSLFKDSKLNLKPEIALPKIEDKYVSLLSDLTVRLDKEDLKKSSRKSKKHMEPDSDSDFAKTPTGKKTDRVDKIKGSKKKATKDSGSSDSQSNTKPPRTAHHKPPKQSSDESNVSGVSDEELEFSSLKKSASKRSRSNKRSEDALDSEKKKKKKRSSDSEESDKPKRKRSKKTKDSDSDSDDLEREIEKLKKLPTLRQKKSKQDSGDSDSSDDAILKRFEKKQLSEKQIKANLERRTIGKPGYKKKSRKSLIEELSSGKDEDEEMPEEEEDHKMSPDKPPNQRPQNEDENDENARARKALLADESTTSDGDVSGLEGIGEKKERQRKENGKENGVASLDDSSDDLSDTKKKSSKSTALLQTKLNSDSESDTVPSKGKKRKHEDSGSASDVSLKDLDDVSTGTDNKDSDSDVGAKKKKKGKKKSSDSSDESGSSSSEGSTTEETDSDGNKKKKKKKKKKGKGKKGKGKKRKRIKKMDDSSESEKEKGSGDEDEDSDDEDGKGKGRKNIRKIIKDKKMSKQGRSALKAEDDRRTRIQERQELYNQVDVVDENSPMKSKMTTKLVLDWDKDKKPLIEVHPKLIKKLKPHQVEAVKFIWDSTIENMTRMKKEAGGGCILAHCMGLGKTLSVIAFTHTMLFNDDVTKMNTALVVCPLNTVLNWQNEWTKWLDEEEQLDVYELSSVKSNPARADALKDWHDNGGIMILGYEMYRNLTLQKNIKKKSQKKIFSEALVDPGPDIVICDEGHVLKNSQTSLSQAMNRIKTRRRIVLTGTPLQNNLNEYHCMVDFVKPNLLGTRKEFLNRFVNPMLNGQHSDSSHHDVKIMKKRAHILHEHLAGCVQRKDYTELTKVLMPKREYVLLVRLSKVQQDLYDTYLTRLGDMPKGRGGQLFSDYQALMRIWTHPWVLRLDEIRQENKRMLKDDDEDSFLDDYDSEDSFINNTSSDDKSDNDKSVKSVKSDVKSEVSPLSDVSDDGFGPRRSKRQARRHRRNRGGDSDRDSDRSTKKAEVRKSKRRNGSASDGSDVEEKKDKIVVSLDWWGDFVKDEDKLNHELSGKLTLLAEILRMCENIGDKILVFSQSLLSLDLIESFLEHWDEETDPDKRVTGQHRWFKNMDYYRMDGSTSAQYRQQWSGEFNDEENSRGRLFLISTRAGSLGTNLVAANRVIIFDASWNPSHDIQSIFRVYRFGQTKPCYIYRFLAQGTMEEKIYERQVTKQSLSQRVVDEHQIDRHFTANDLQELYNFQPLRWTEENEEREMPVLPKDRLLAEMLSDKKDWIVKYHEHDSLLENKIGEDLTEEERKKAWEEYEAEKKGIYTAARATYTNYRQNTMASSTQQWLDYYGVQQQNPYQMATTQQPGMSLQNIEQVARSIYAANPGINQEQLQMKVQNYIEMVQHQQQAWYRQQQEERLAHERMKMAQMEAASRQRMQAYRDMAQNAQGTSQNRQTSAATTLASMLKPSSQDMK